MKLSSKDMLGIQDLPREEIDLILDTAASFREISERTIKKVPALRGKTVITLFFEASTRTRTSFEIAAKRLSADTINISASTSSVVKGETLIDTARNLESMNPDIIVIRHSVAGAAHILSDILQKQSIINAGDGAHEHPSQALLDMLTIREVKGRVEGLRVAIVGDIAHRRVARSDVQLLTLLGAKVRMCAPRTLLPCGMRTWPVTVYEHLATACKGVDAIICLRLQLERQKAGLLPDLREYAMTYGLDFSHLQQASPDVKIMHPGPINRGVEISSALADASNSLVLNQVASGVAVRMAILYLHMTRETAEER